MKPDLPNRKCNYFGYSVNWSARLAREVTHGDAHKSRQAHWGASRNQRRRKREKDNGAAEFNRPPVQQLRLPAGLQPLTAADGARTARRKKRTGPPAKPVFTGRYAGVILSGSSLLPLCVEDATCCTKTTSNKLINNIQLL